MNAKRHEIIRAEIAVADAVHVLDELAGNVMDGEGEELLPGKD